MNRNTGTTKKREAKKVLRLTRRREKRFPKQTRNISKSIQRPQELRLKEIAGIDIRKKQKRK